MQELARLGCGAALAALIGWGGPASATETLPFFMRSGPYGDALLLAPPGRRDWSATSGLAATGTPVSTGQGAGASPLAGGRSELRGTTKRTSRDDEDDDDDETGASRSRPGSLSTGFVRVPDATPSQSRRSRSSLGPHLEPLTQFELSERASLGLIGQADRLEVKPGSAVPAGAAAAARSGAGAAPSIKAKDVGVGLSLEFKIGR